MEETELSKFIRSELQTLLDDLNAGLTPSNTVLEEVVKNELMRQFAKNLASQH